MAAAIKAQTFAGKEHIEIKAALQFDDPPEAPDTTSSGSLCQLGKK
jgi:hypothetical protein